MGIQTLNLKRNASTGLGGLIGKAVSSILGVPAGVSSTWNAAAREVAVQQKQDACIDLLSIGDIKNCQHAWLAVHQLEEESAKKKGQAIMAGIGNDDLNTFLQSLDKNVKAGITAFEKAYNVGYAWFGDRCQKFTGEAEFRRYAADLIGPLEKEDKAALEAVNSRLTGYAEARKQLGI